MRVSRAIGIQTLTTSIMFLLLVLAVSFYWVRLDTGQARIRDDAITLRDYRLLSEVVSGWTLSGNFVFGRQQTDLLEVGLGQGEQIATLALELSRESLALAYADAFSTLITLVNQTQELFLLTRGASPEQFQNYYSLWDANSQGVIKLVVSLGESLISASEENSILAATERRNLLTLIASGCAIFSLLIIGLWRWATRLIVRPLANLTQTARQALRQGAEMKGVDTHIDEIGSLSKSINDFTASLADRVEQRTRMLKRQQKYLQQEVELRKQAQTEAQEAAEKAKSASRAKSQFLANMSHEFRTPLNAIMGGAQLLGIMELKQDAQNWAHRIEDSGQHLLALLNTVLDFSQLQDGGFVLSRDNFPAASLYQHCRSIFAVNAEEKDLEFELDIDPQIPDQLFGDCIRIQQILAHLIGNAIKFTESGCISVSVKANWFDDQHLQLDWEFSDTGIGIPLDSRERIFEYFEQADNSDSRQYGGSGLGLTISRELARMMGGDITLESEVGVGSTFYCSIIVESQIVGSHRANTQKDPQGRNVSSEAGQNSSSAAPRLEVL